MNKYFGWIFALIASMTMVSAYATDEIATSEDAAVEDEVVVEEDSSAAEDQVVAFDDQDEE